MATHEETKILGYLRQHPTARLGQILSACLPGLPADWGERVISDLEWLGYVTVYHAGDDLALQLTDRGRRCGLR